MESAISRKNKWITQEGNNLEVCAIKGNFDDAQTGVKQIFTDKVLAEKLAEHNIVFSSCQLNQLGAPGATDCLLFLRLL